MNTFFKDSKNNIDITWDVLINDLNKVVSYNPYCKSDNYYEVFKHIILSMIYGKEVILLDSDFSNEELVSSTGFLEYHSFTQDLISTESVRISDKRDLIDKLKNTGNNWKVTLFTSGTTGVPKKMSHNFISITRFVKYSHLNNIWGFAYNPTHMAGVQVFLQCLLNGNKIIRLFGLEQKDIYKAIKENEISNISATPTFYGLLLPCDEMFFSVNRITSGGERFKEKTMFQLKHIFPNAKITNVYASTEAGTLFVSDNDVFTVKSEFDPLIKFDDNELLIHKSLLGISEANSNDWYRTGDLIEVIARNPLKFRFASRKSEMINVGGYKVNPAEVEECILSLSGVQNVRVYSKSNSVVGSIICCEIVCDDQLLEESVIRKYLQSKIQEFKIPRVIRFVDNLESTRTGKVKRI